MMSKPAARRERDSLLRHTTQHTQLPSEKGRSSFCAKDGIEPPAEVTAGGWQWRPLISLPIVAASAQFTRAAPLGQLQGLTMSWLASHALAITSTAPVVQGAALRCGRPRPHAVLLQRTSCQPWRCR